MSMHFEKVGHFIGEVFEVPCIGKESNFIDKNKTVTKVN